MIIRRSTEMMTFRCIAMTFSRSLILCPKFSNRSSIQSFGYTTRKIVRYLQFQGEVELEIGRLSINHNAVTKRRFLRDELRFSLERI